MSDEEKSASDEEEATTQTLASSRTRRDNAGKRFFPIFPCVDLISSLIDLQEAEC